MSVKSEMLVSFHIFIRIDWDKVLIPVKFLLKWSVGAWIYGGAVQNLSMKRKPAH